jgi:transcriptional regulator with XRE-family HTH domain
MALLKRGRCRLRELMGDMSPADVADRMNVHESTVSRWLKGETDMSYENIIMASRIFNCLPEEVVELIEQPRKVIKKGKRK